MSSSFITNQSRSSDLGSFSSQSLQSSEYVPGHLIWRECSFTSIKYDSISSEALVGTYIYLLVFKHHRSQNWMYMPVIR